MIGLQHQDLMLKQGENQTKLPVPVPLCFPGIPGEFPPGVPALPTPPQSPAPWSGAWWAREAQPAWLSARHNLALPWAQGGAAQGLGLRFRPHLLLVA